MDILFYWPQNAGIFKVALKLLNFWTGHVARMGREIHTGFC